MSEPYDEKMFCCDRCGDFFEKTQMIEDDELWYCEACYKILVEGGDL